ncbi:MAG TPA: phosphotransferase [Acidimicrobiia bacterium]|nr:phosphotransferase [Acidimicrobiia bacterium]
MAEPGRLLGEGRTATVHEFDERRVIKVLRPGFPESLLRREAEATRAAVAAGVSAPKVHDLERVGDRPGIVLDRIAGDSMVDLIIANLERVEHWARLLAETHADVLTHTTSDLMDVGDVLRAKIKHAKSLSRRQRRAALHALKTLPGGNSLLHGDFHPLNVFVTDNDVVTIDWSDASRGPPAGDIARTTWLISPNAIPPDFPGRDRLIDAVDRFGSVYSEEIMKRVAIQKADVEAWSLPVLAGRLSEEIEWEIEPILQRIDKLIA